MWQTLIDSNSLHQQLTQTPSDRTWLILDCRHDLSDPAWGLTTWALGHIPSAQFISIDHDLADLPLVGNIFLDTGSASPIKKEQPFEHGRHPLPIFNRLMYRLATLGLSQHTPQVVVYDAHGGMFAARAWWLLRHIGYTSVAVLDGGLPSWQSAGYPLSSATAEEVLNTKKAVGRGNETEPPHSQTPPKKESSLIYRTVSMGDIQNYSDRYFLIDARAPDRFAGQNETLDPVAGHIPGAHNRCWKDNLGAEGGFKSIEQLQIEWRALLAKAGDRNPVVYCGSGVSACHHILAMEHAGFVPATLYPGSWSQWSRQPNNPVATGSI